MKKTVNISHEFRLCDACNNQTIKCHGNYYFYINTYKYIN